MIEIATHGAVILLLTLLAATALTIVRMRDLFAAVMLTGIYSFLGAGWMMMLDAPDVAFTEAAVGAGIATVLMLSTLALTSRVSKPVRTSPVALVVVSLTGMALVVGTIDMPHYGDVAAPIHQHVAPEYLSDSVPTSHGDPIHGDPIHGDPVHGDSGRGDSVHVGVPNIITAVLASYRGYDTLGETVVIFTAGAAVLMLLRGPRN